MDKLTTPRKKTKMRFLRTALATVCVLAITVTVIGACRYGPAVKAYAQYEPQEGDILFQTMPHSRLADTIEGTTNSPLTHCGIVAEVDGKWVVYEAFRGVEVTPLHEFVARGRGQAFSAYRLKAEHTAHIPATLRQARDYLGRPYDIRYRLDEEHIYCSELIYKAFEKASGEKLGELVRLGDLDWEPYQANIEYFENGPVPLDRLMITPRDLAEAEQIELTYRFEGKTGLK